MSQVSYGTITITDTTDIEDVFLIYKGSSSNTVAPSIVWSGSTNDWKTDITQITDDYIWAITVFKRTGITITSTNYTDYYSDPVCLTGEPGISINVTSIKYSTVYTQTQPDDSTFTATNPPDVPEGGWLWSRTLFSNGQSMYSKAKQGKSPTVSKTGNTVTIVGADGNTVTVTDGTNGQSYYTYVRYSVNSDGSNMVTTPTSSTKYIGVYSGTSSTVPAYTSFIWSKYVGENGSPGGTGPQGVSVTSVRELYYLTNGNAPSKPTSSTTIYDDDRVGAWTSVVPAYITNGKYYVSLETTLSNSTKVWSDVILDQALTDANYNAYLAQSLSQNANENANGAMSQAIEAQYQTEALAAKVKHYWWDEIGAHIASGINGADVAEGTVSTYGFNSLVGLASMTFGYNSYKTVELDGSVPALKFYKPSKTAQGALTATLDSNGLILSEGGVQAGTAGQSGFIYLSTKNYGSNLTINGHEASNWREIIGTKFGVDVDGNLYASSATISGAITATSLTLGSGVQIPASTGISGLSTVATSGSYNDLSNKPTIPSLTGYIYQNGTVGTTPADGATGFVVSSSGLLTASNAVIYGSIYASKGYIGGWQIGTDGNKTLHNGSANTSPTIGNNTIILSKGLTSTTSIAGSTGQQTWTIAVGTNFGVTTAGKIYATGAEISGKITVGSGSTIDSGATINGTPASTVVSNASTGAQAATDLSTFKTTVSSTYATKSSAVAKTQQIYYRSSAESNGTPIKPTGYPTAWVTEEGNKWSTNATTTSGWSRKITPISNGTGENVTKYLYLWTATQKQLVDGTVVALTSSDIALDDSTTVIDGGKIITGSVSANSINASSGTFATALIPQLTIGKIDTLQATLDGKAASGAENTALSYLSYDSTNGLKIAGSNPSSTTTNYIQITSNNINIVKSSTYKATIDATNGLLIYAGDASNAVAQFGSTMRIGKANNSAFHVNPSSLQAYYMNGTTRTLYFEVSPTGMSYGSYTVASTAYADQAEDDAKTAAQGYADTAEANASYSVEIKASTIDYSNNEATLVATPYYQGSTSMPTGVTISYQWYKDSVSNNNKVGTNSNTLSVTSSMGLNHVYICVIS